ncbi:MAG: hypothetical protein KAR20_22320, partial [Candidatus Heimdallarchaeota archaeon]|nr:hypothetical protein [Candidatus Heimdallarchaeota archaeon]
MNFKEFSLPPIAEHNSSAIIPTIKGVPFFKYGVHAYYFLNFRTAKGLCVTISHKDIVQPGLSRFLKANPKTYKYFPKLKSLLQRYHYGFNLLEQMMLITVPHSVTPMGNGRFLVNLWSYFGYLDIDCKNRSVKYIGIEENDDDHVLGSQQYYDVQKDELYYMSYSLKDSLKRIANPEQEVFCKILKRENKAGEAKEIWTGQFADYLHEIIINKTRQYCVVCQMGMYTDKQNDIIPSKVLVLDLQNGKSWTISRFIVAAHAQSDPDDPDIVYFSNHNFNFKHSNIFKLLKNATYDVNFRGAASVYKYRLTANGPVELGEFTHPDLFRLTNSHVFNHRGQKILAVIGFPNFIFLADANSMEFIKKIELNPPWSIGTIAPSPDGEKIYAQST